MPSVDANKVPDGNPLNQAGTCPAPCTGKAMVTRGKTAAVVLITSLLAISAMPAVAASTHEVCTALQHDCTSNAVLARCCCGDRSGVHPSPVPSDRTHAVPDSVQGLDCAGLVPDAAMTAGWMVHEFPAPLSRPPNLPILFGDLRI